MDKPDRVEARNNEESIEGDLSGCISDFPRLICEEGKMKEFIEVLRQFLTDLIVVYPEYGEGDKLHENLRVLLDGRNDDGCNHELYVHCMKVFPERFMDILYKSSDIFKGDDGGVDVEFLPGLDFREIWKLGVTEETEVVIWKYLQLILFSLIESQSKHNIFEKSNDLIDVVMRDDIREKLRQVVDELGSYMGKGDEGEGLDVGGGSKLSDLEGIFKSFGDDGGIFEGLGSDKSAGGGKDSNDDSNDDLKGPNFASIQENLDKMLKGKIGMLAKEIAEETMNNRKAEDGETPLGGLFDMFEEGVDMEGKGASEMFDKILKNPGKIMGLVQNIGTKLDTKIKSGEIKESELLEEASNMMSCMKSMPGMPSNMSELFSKMGVPSKAANNKAAQSMVQTNLAHRASACKMRERLQAKLKMKDTETNNLMEQNMEQLRVLQSRLIDQGRGDDLGVDKGEEGLSGKLEDGGKRRVRRRKAVKPLCGGV